MLSNRTVIARHTATNACIIPVAPRAAISCRRGSPWGIGFVLELLMLLGILPAAGGLPARADTPLWPPSVQVTSSQRFDRDLDRDGNGRQDLLDAWFAGAATWEDLRRATQPVVSAAAAAKAGRAGGDDLAAMTASLPVGGSAAGAAPVSGTPENGIWAAGHVRLICLGGAGGLRSARAAAQQEGVCRTIHELQIGGPVTVLAVDAAGLRALLAGGPDGRLLLDCDGVPALDAGRALVGVPAVEAAPWNLGDDWSSTIAVLDSGCDTAHGDLGDDPDDDIDGPAPAVGDQGDWYPADLGWSLFDGYKVVGWHDVTDDFPLAQGPWDYHYHGTALAGVAAGRGMVDDAYRGVSPGGRLTVVKFYDFDATWHTWAGDFLAACAWTLANRDLYRIRTVLCAVNWEVDAGLSDALDALVDAGIVPVAAMGNQGDDPAGPGYPARLPQVLTVGAVNDARAVAAFSGRGLGGQGKPDLVAPGGGLLADRGRITAADNEPDDSYSGRAGTSLAAAHAAGAVYLLDDALAKSGLILPSERASALARMAVLKVAAAPVSAAETADGAAETALPAYTGHDAVRGWGLLRVDAAVSGLLQPLVSGRSQTVSLAVGTAQTVAARRLITNAGVRTLVEAAPTAGLDVCLELLDPRWLQDDPLGTQIIRMNTHGAGVSEFAYLDHEQDAWFFLVVKAMAGQGTVTLSLREADSFDARGAVVSLPGTLTGAPNTATLAGLPGPSLILPSRVTIDQVARSVNVLDANGAFRTGWPVFLFPHPSSQGGLTQPLAWDLDGNPGDEIVLASEFGSVYFFQAGGQYQEIKLDFNNALTAPVGLVTAAGEKRVAVVDKLGVARVWSQGPVLRAQRALGHSLPLQPAVGTLDLSGGEALVVAFGDGHLTALDADLNPLPGWPLNLGPALEIAPVLADLDGDKRHEIVVPAWARSQGDLRMRVLRPDGSFGTGDGAHVPAPQGGRWLALSPAVVAGGYLYGGLQVAVVGLADNGLTGDRARWVLGQGSLLPGGSPASTAWSGFGVRATTAQSVLTLDDSHLPAPLVFDQSGDGASEVSALVHVRWQDLLYGLTTIPGAATAWFSPAGQDRPFSQRQPVGIGGPLADPVGRLGTLLVPLQDGALLRVQVVDEEVTLAPLAAGLGPDPLWRAARADGRNSGAYPLGDVITGVPVAEAHGVSLLAYPNPGAGRFHFRLEGALAPADLRLEIYDLRGRRVAAVAGVAGEPVRQWAGCDEAGRPVAAGTYLARARAQGRTWVTRIVLTR